MDDAPRLAELLRSIATGRTVDWDDVAETPSDESTASLIEELKVLSQIAEVHGNARRDAASDAVDDEPLSSWGPLTILERVGRGSYGDVYRAFDTRLDREVALKLLRRRAEADGPHVIEEGRLLAKVRHPNAITVHGADCIDGRTGIWMEFIEGQTLEQELKARGPLAGGDVIAIGIDICRALDAVHKAGIVHRDIKAQNVMREPAGRTVLMDFGSGFSEVSGEPTGGTPLYLAPEVLAGEPATARSDIYAVGVLLYHLLSGSYPLEARTLAEVRALHETGRRTRLRDARRDVPARLAEIVERACAPRKGNRFATAAQMQTALESVRSRESAHWRWAAAAGLVAFVALVVAISTPRGRIDNPPAAAAAPAASAPPVLPDRQPAQPSPDAVAPTVKAVSTAAADPIPPRFFKPRGWVLITAFDNQTGGAVPDGAAEYVFERELSNSPFVNVAPRDRIADALRLMAKPPDTAVDAATGREVAIRDGRIDAVITGRIQKIGTGFELSALIVKPADGVVLAALSEDAARQADLPAAIRRAAVAVRKALGERLPPAQTDALEKVTTPSLHAAQLYTQADRAFAAGGFDGAGVAARLLEQAIRSDPAFSSAHLLLGRAYFLSDQTGKAIEHFQRAYALADRASERERLYIGAAHHTYVLRHDEEAAVMYESLLRMYPDHYWAINDLSAVYFRLQRNADRHPLTLRLADLRPTSVAANWDAVSSLSLLPDGFAQARPYFERCVTLVAQRADGITPEMAENIRLFPAYQHWQEGNITAAHDALIQAEREGAKPSTKTAYLHMTFGKLANTETRLLQALSPAERPMHLALLALFRGNGPGARAHLADSVKLRTPDLGPAAVALVRLDTRADAEQVHRELGNRLATAKNPFFAWKMDHDIVTGVLALDRGQVREGSALLESVLPRRPFRAPHVLLAWELLAQTYHATGRSEDARRVLRQASSDLAPNTTAIAFAMRLRLQLAQLEREAGHVAEAARIEDSLRQQLAFADADHPILKALGSDRKQVLGAADVDAAVGDRR